MKTKAYIGIDPGASGAICLLVPDIDVIIFTGTTVEPALLRQSLMSVAGEYNLAHIMLEEVHSLHGMSAKSNFTFGFNVGTIQAILGTTGIGFDLVQPKVWQKETGIKFPQKSKPAQKKKITADVVKRLYPYANIHGPKGGLLDGRSDALMIAHYCRLKY